MSMEHGPRKWSSINIKLMNIRSSFRKKKKDLNNPLLPVAIRISSLLQVVTPYHIRTCRVWMCTLTKFQWIDSVPWFCLIDFSLICRESHCIWKHSLLIWSQFIQQRRPDLFIRESQPFHKNWFPFLVEFGRGLVETLEIWLKHQNLLGCQFSLLCSFFNTWII